MIMYSICNPKAIIPKVIFQIPECSIGRLACNVARGGPSINPTQ